MRIFLGKLTNMIENQIRNFLKKTFEYQPLESLFNMGRTFNEFYKQATKHNTNECMNMNTILLYFLDRIRMQTRAWILIHKDGDIIT